MQINFSVLGHGHIEVTLSTKSWCIPEKVISKFDSRAQQLSVDSEKIVLNVPYTESLPQSLDKVESEKKKLGVTGISVSLITLEQVFLKYVRQNRFYIVILLLFSYFIIGYRIVRSEDSGKHLNELFTAPLQKVTGTELCMQTISALFCKKFTYIRKNLTVLLTIVCISLLDICFINTKIRYIFDDILYIF